MNRPQPLTVNREELEALRDRAHRRALRPEDAPLVEALAATVVVLSETVAKKSGCIRRLLQRLFGIKSETKRRLFGDDPGNPPTPPPADSSAGNGANGSGGTARAKRPGHGRNGAAAYTGALHVVVPHLHLKLGLRCPACARGALGHADPSPLVYVQAQVPVTATVYDCERLRCSACGKEFTAPPPREAALRKYDPKVGVLIAMLKYGAGMPFARLAALEKMAGIPLPPAVQWERVVETALPCEPVLKALWQHAAGGQVIHNDDTTMKVLELMTKQGPQHAAEAAERPASERTGIFTSGLISLVGPHRIALFRTGHQHAGENLADLLSRRAPEAPPPIQMCDAASRNLPADFRRLLANCLGHARRQFVDILEAFPDACRYVIETLASVYRNDAQTQATKMDPLTRLAYHQQHSAPLMDALQSWCHAQLQEHHVEPNSGLGQAIQYLLRHWEPLTLFLREPGAPLDNNVCERALKKAILHRKNALFYKTLRGARVGDLFMSLIHTCQLNGVNALDYLQTLIQQTCHVAAAPERWLPWTYRDTLTTLNTS